MPSGKGSSYVTSHSVLPILLRQVIAPFVFKELLLKLHGRRRSMLSLPDSIFEGFALLEDCVSSNQVNAEELTYWRMVAVGPEAGTAAAL